MYSIMLYLLSSFSFFPLFVYVMTRFFIHFVFFFILTYFICIFCNVSPFIFIVETNLRWIYSYLLFFFIFHSFSSFILLFRFSPLLQCEAIYFFIYFSSSFPCSEIFLFWCVCVLIIFPYLVSHPFPLSLIASMPFLLFLLFLLLVPVVVTLLFSFRFLFFI